MPERDTYPTGVPCWVDVVQPDLDATMAFYASLFGWSYELRTPPGAPQRYAYIRLGGLTVGGLGGPPRVDEPDGWTTYVCVDSADDSVDAVTEAGGSVLFPPADVGPAGRTALCADPSGATIGLWQPGETTGAQLVNLPGSWNFSDLHTNDLDGAERFYASVFGWDLDTIEGGDGRKAGMWRLSGYGDFLAERDPDIRARQAEDAAPAGFLDAIALVGWTDDPHAGSDRWGIVFSVADAGAAVATACDLGAEVVTPLVDTQYNRMATIRDPQGTVLTLSQYRPTSG